MALSIARLTGADFDSNSIEVDNWVEGISGAILLDFTLFLN
jgi:hypothetical protein